MNASRRPVFACYRNRAPWLGNAGILTVAAATFLLAAPPTLAGPITPGNLVVVRFGDGAAALSTAAAAVFLDEFTTAGVLVQSIPLATTGSSALTASGSAATEGILSRSQDGTRLTLAGYRKDVGGANPPGDVPATTNRVIGVVNVDGTVDTTYALTDTTATIRSVVSATGTGSGYYIATSTSVRYAAAPGPAATSVSLDPRNSRQVILSGNTLLVSNGSTAITAKVQSYGILPTGATTPVPIVNLATSDAVNGFWLADLDATVPGDDTLYLTSTIANTLIKFSWDGATWAQAGSISASGCQNITGIVSGASVNLFLTSPNGTSRLFSLTDSSGHSGTLTGSLAALATAPANTGFRGINAFLPPAASYQFEALNFVGADVHTMWKGTVGMPPKIQASADLLIWSLVGTATETAAGVFEITETPSPGASRRFYRATP